MEKGQGPKSIATELLEANPENPRMIFDPEELDLLQKSIAEVGILVPLIVFAKGDGKYVLLDGDRRLRCARRLNLREVPVNIIAPPSRIENILRMFNIHNVREQWQLMPTALKLQQLMDYLHSTKDEQLSELTGMTVSTVRRCKKLLKFSVTFQQAVLRGELKPDYLIEMYPVVTSLRRSLPEFYESYGFEKLVEAFVSMERHGQIKAVTDFRKLSKIVNAEKRGVSRRRILETLNRLISDRNFTIDDAFEYSVSAIYQTTNLQRKGEALLRDLGEFDASGINKQTGKSLRRTLEELKVALTELLTRLS